VKKVVLCYFPHVVFSNNAFIFLYPNSNKDDGKVSIVEYMSFICAYSDMDIMQRIELYELLFSCCA